MKCPKCESENIKCYNGIQIGKQDCICEDCEFIFYSKAYREKTIKLKNNNFKE